MSIEDVRSLVAERQRYDDWLTALDARKAETPERVYQRVRGDYEARRGDVLTRLGAFVSDLESMAAELGARRDDHASQIESLEEQRIEAMLRNAVGEYDEAHWNTLRSDVDTKIATLTADRDQVQRQLDEVAALLTDARPASGADDRSASVAAPAEAGNAVVAPAGDAPAGDAPAALSAEEPAHASPAAETAPMAHDTDSVWPLVGATVQVKTVTKSLVDALAAAAIDPEPVEGMIDLTAETVEAPVFTNPNARHEPMHELASLADGLPMVSDGETELELPEPTVTMHGDDRDDVDDALAMFHRTPVPAAPSVSAASSAPRREDPFDDLAFLNSVMAPATTAAPVAGKPATAAGEPSPDATKTLRCTECGTMNLPTEWYCERCGGELAAF